MNATIDLSLIAAAQPPDGVQSNFINPPNFDNATIATVVLCVFSTTLAVTARMVTKVFMIKQVATEDYMVLVSWAIFMAFNSIVLKNGLEGYDRHQWDVTAATAMSLARRGNIGEILYAPTIWLAKTSILLQLIHIFASNHVGLLYWSIHALIWINFAFYIGLPFALYFECSPREKIWMPNLPGHCINIEAYLVATGAFNILSDLCILLFPLWAIWHLQMPVRRKLGVSAVFATGTFACITSIIRLIYTLRLFERDDQTFLVGQVGLWGNAEVATVILCCCFPILPRFFKSLSRRPQTRTAAPYSKSMSSFKLKKVKPGMDSMELSNVQGSQVDMDTRVNGRYVELGDITLDYTGKNEARPKNITRISAANAGHDDQQREKHGIRKTVTVETLRQGGSGNA